MVKPAPPKPTDLEEWLNNHYIESVTAKYDHDNLSSWVTYTLKTNDLSWPRMNGVFESKTIKGSTFDKLCEFNRAPYPFSLVVVRKEVREKIEAYYEWHNEHKKDVEEYERLKKKLGI